MRYNTNKCGKIHKCEKIQVNAVKWKIQVNSLKWKIQVNADN